MVDFSGPLKREACLDTTAFELSGNTDDALRDLAYLPFDGILSLILKCTFSAEGSDWSHLLRKVLKRGQLL